MGKVVEEEVLEGESDSRQYQYRGMRHKVSSLSGYNQNQSTHRILESVYRVGNFLFFLESIQCHDKWLSTIVSTIVSTIARSIVSAVVSTVRALSLLSINQSLSQSPFLTRSKSQKYSTLKS